MFLVSFTHFFIPSLVAWSGSFSNPNFEGRYPQDAGREPFFFDALR